MLAVSCDDMCPGCTWIGGKLRECEGRLAAAEAANERLRHGQQIEGDYVCPNELRAVNAETETNRLREVLLRIVRRYDSGEWVPPTWARDVAHAALPL